LRRATEPFYTTKGVGKGTGLGLSMVHGIAEQFGGRFTLASELGKGTAAHLWLPIVNKAKSPAAEVERVIRPVARSLSILAVDDDNLVLTNTVAMLDDLGHRVVAARSGAEALDILRRGEKFDLAITDQVMPEMTGQQLATLIEAEWPQMQILIATGFAEMGPGPQRRAKINKPFSQEELSDKITEMTAIATDEHVVPFRPSKGK
jgi:CheY-like chemotaxis protein